MKKRIVLAACRSVSPKKSDFNNLKTVKTLKTETVSINNEINLATTAYPLNKQSTSQGIMAVSTRNVCVDSFNILKGLNQGQFDNYATDYNKIHQNHTFLNSNKEIMDEDSKILLSMMLNKKWDTLCVKVQYAGFNGIKNDLKRYLIFND
ncbi:hypothetical protein [Providencia alcalifaciens]|uniref:hypothetical protein n=1 Tax=Providencia alcalifaciens TaxID=126385 RepID=UPI001D16E254|nr:hypothetical protein [Providencia alcalifaciens]